MKDGFKVIDADRHILEPSDLYQKYLPERFKNRVHLAGPNQTVRHTNLRMISCDGRSWQGEGERQERKVAQPVSALKDCERPRHRGAANPAQS